MKLKSNQKILFIGDSVTDCGCNKINGEGLYGELGNGYVNMFNNLLLINYPNLMPRVINKGISGHTIRDLKARWEKDVLLEQPDYLFILIGVNDVWRQFDQPFKMEKHIHLAEYEETLNSLVELTNPLTSEIFLMTPFYLEVNKGDDMRKKLDGYGEVVKRVGQKYNLTVIDLQNAFDELLTHYPTQLISGDRVHPNSLGHTFIAKTIIDNL